jgi:phosphoserine phosphatase RsbU/P
VAKSAPQQKRLRLYTEQPPKLVPPPDTVGCLPELLRAFHAVTGCPLRYEHGSEASESAGRPAWSMPIRGEAEYATGRLVLEPPSVEQGERNNKNEKPTKPVKGSAILGSGGIEAESRAVRLLAGSIADVLGELLQTRHALRQREAELAAGVPVVPHREEEKHLAARLEAVLRAGIDAVDCRAAGVYLLDDATTELKLRCSCGLPPDRLAAPARPLQGALADLEALLGHAVVLDDDSVMPTWNAPEDFPAAVCVPISTPTMLLGTLWVFSNEKRGFSDHETNILEVISGRLASDLEREMLLRAGVDAARLQKQVAAAERLQRNELPTIAPLLDGWDVAGCTAQAENVGGAFHDWFCLPDGLLAVAVGQADGGGIAGAMTADAAKTALRSHAPYHRQADRILQQVNLTLWTGSAGDRHVTLFEGLIETATGRVCCASAGRPSIMLLGVDGVLSVGRNSIKLGESAEADFEQFGYELRPGETLLIFTGGSIADAAGCLATETAVANALQGKHDLAAAELAAAAQAALIAQNPDHERRDRSILAVKRTTA